MKIALIGTGGVGGYFGAKLEKLCLAPKAPINKNQSHNCLSGGEV